MVFYKLHMSLSNKLTSDLLIFLFDLGIFAWRQNTQGTYDAKKGVYRPAAKVGVPDIIAVAPPDGTFLGIEVKIGRDRLSEVQEGFKSSIRHVGGHYIVAKDYDTATSDILKIIKYEISKD